MRINEYTDVSQCGVESGEAWARLFKAGLS